MTKKPDQRYENNYRYTPEQMKGLWKRFFIGWGISAVIGILFIVIFSAITFNMYDPQGQGNPMPEWVNTVGTAVLLLTILGFPFLFAAWLGGRSIHRWGPLGTVTAIVGMIIAIVGESISVAYLIVGGALFLIGVVVSFYLGKISDVPMWIQLPILNSPRAYVNKPKTKKAKKK